VSPPSLLLDLGGAVQRRGQLWEAAAELLLYLRCDRSRVAGGVVASALSVDADVGEAALAILRDLGS
jgi:hypothetical protein